MDSTGNNIKQLDNITEPSICQAQCQVTIGCQYYVFYKSINTCFLKDSVGRKIPNSDGIIGPRTCPGKCIKLVSILIFIQKQFYIDKPYLHVNLL